MAGRFLDCSVGQDTQMYHNGKTSSQDSRALKVPTRYLDGIGNYLGN